MNKKRILVADDNLVVLNAMKLGLNAAGYDVYTATDGSDAVALAGRIYPDVVIMDVNFPPDISQGGMDWNGFRILEWMQRTGASGIAPAIIITSDDVETHHAAAVEVGAVALFQKPVNMPDLLEIIEESTRGAPAPG